MNTVKSTMHHRLITITLLGLLSVRDACSAEYELFKHPPVPGLPANNDPTTHDTPQSTVKFPPGPPMLLDSYLAPVMQAIAYHIELLQYEPISMTTIEPPFEVTGDSSSTASSVFGQFPTTTNKPSSIPWWQSTEKPAIPTTSQVVPSTQKPTSTIWWQPSFTTTTTKKPSSIIWWQPPSTTTTSKPSLSTSQKPITLWWQTTTTQKPAIAATEKPTTLWWQTTTTQKPPVITTTESPSTLWWQTTSTKKPSVITESPSTFWWQTTTTSKPAIITTTEKQSTPWWQTTTQKLSTTQKPSTLWWQTTTKPTSSIWIQPLSTTSKPGFAPWWQSTTKPTTSKPITSKPTQSEWWKPPSTTTTRKPWWDPTQTAHKPTSWWDKPSTTTTQKPWWQQSTTQQRPADSWWSATKPTTQWWQTTKAPWWQTTTTSQPFNHWWLGASTTIRTTQKPWWQKPSTKPPISTNTQNLWESPAWAQNKPSRIPSLYTTSRTDDPSIPDTTPHHLPGNFAPIAPYYIRPTIIAPNVGISDINNQGSQAFQQTSEIHISTTSRTPPIPQRYSERTTAGWPFESPSLAADSNFMDWLFQEKAKKLPNDIEYDFSFLDPLPGSLIQDILKEKSELPALLDRDNINEFLRIYDDFYGRYRPISGKKRIPPTKPYVEFLMLYDLLKREAKALNLTNYEGYSATMLRELAETSKRSAEIQLHTMMTRMLQRGHVKRQDVITRVQMIIKDLENPSSVTAKSLHVIPPLQFVP